VDYGLTTHFILWIIRQPITLFYGLLVNHSFYSVDYWLTSHFILWIIG